MPLGFQSLSHGVVAFGFFNIETDLLLLDRQVFWCRDFCELASDLARTAPDRLFQAQLRAWAMPGPAELGDLHGAIAGVAHHGLIGELYRRWPFPADPAGFRQKPAGAAPRQEVQALVERFGQPRKLEVWADPERDEMALGELRFSPDGVRALLDYVWRGGMPGWLDGQRPDYLWEAAAAWRESRNPFVAGLGLDPRQVGVRV